MALFATLALQGPSASSVGSSVFDFLEKYQAQELIIPFLLTFVIIYGVLDMTKLFNNRINGIVALSVSFFAIFYGPYGAMGQFLTQLYGTGAVVIVGIVIFMIIIGAMSLGGPRWNRNMGVFQRLFGVSSGVTVGIILVIVLMFLLATGWFKNIGIVLDSDTTALMIIVLVLVVLFAIITRPSRSRAMWNQWFPNQDDGEI